MLILFAWIAGILLVMALGLRGIFTLLVLAAIAVVGYFAFLLAIAAIIHLSILLGIA